MHHSDGGGDENTSTYKKFKSHNEVEIGEAYKTGPARIQLDDLDSLIPFGHIVQYIQQGVGMVLVQPDNPAQLLDIENIISTKDKQVIGFIYEPIGPITNPLYSVQLYPDYVDHVMA